MTRDNSPKERQQKHLERKRARKANYDRILIVSEGSKTEPNYFREIRNTFRLHTANIQVQPSELGSAPIQVVKFAKSLFENGDYRKNIQKKAFERVYAVFDRDDHKSYFDALLLAESLNGKLKNDINTSVIFQPITSIPSFEIWLLLHFEDIQSPLSRDEVITRLKRYLPQYSKGLGNSFAITKEFLPVAMKRADRLALRFNSKTDPEPFTAIAELVRLLTTLRLNIETH